jgi:alkyldihydroxyacetonephosphate synthase
MLGHDPWTVPIATVGGTISTNSLGYRGAQYGSMGDEVLGLQVVLGDASVLELRPVARSSTGPRLKHLFAGAEGTLGVITEAVLRAFPQPESRRLLALDFPDFDSGFHAVEAMFAIGLVPAMIDFGQTYSGSRDNRERFTPDGARGRMQLAFEGYTESVRAARRRALRIANGFGAHRLSGRVAREFWQNRHVIADRIRQRRREGQEDDQRADWLPAGAAFDFVHVAMPASRVLDFRDRVADLLRTWGVSIREWGLWNQPELFSVVMQRDVDSPEDAAAFADAVDAVLRLAQDCGGSMEYCHGAGIRLASLMEREHGRGLGLLQSIKSAVDPQGILNPGKLGL